ncbi:MAG: hypothetical protein ACLTXT_00980 [Ruminococcus callidus]
MDLFWDYLCEADQYLERRVRMVFVGDRADSGSPAKAHGRTGTRFQGL